MRPVSRRAKRTASAKALAPSYIPAATFATAGIITPSDPARRGSHVSVAFEHGYEIVQALIARGIIGDFRAPDIMRFGFAPLYVRYADVWHAAQRLRAVIADGLWRDPRFAEKSAVT